MSGVVPIPVRMFWNAVSTFVESRADVSMKDRVFFSGDRGKERDGEMEGERGKEREMEVIYTSTDRLKQSRKVNREGERRANLRKP